MKKLLFCLPCLSCLLLTPACQTEIIHDIPEDEANAIMAVLQQQGLQAEKLRVAQGREATYTIQVGRADAVEAWRVLREQNLPRPVRQGLGEVFSNASLVPTATQERAMFHHALAGEISKTLQSLEGVLEARVHVVLPERDPLAPPDQPGPAPRASVLLRTRGSAPLSPEQIKKLVAGSVDALEPEQVVVVIASSTAKPRTAAAAGPLTAVGPFAVAPGSKTLLRFTLVGCLLLVLALSLTLALVLRRYRLLARTALRAATPTPAAGARNLESSLSLMERSLSRTSRTIGGGRDS